MNGNTKRYARATCSPIVRYGLIAVAIMLLNGCVTNARRVDVGVYDAHNDNHVADFYEYEYYPDQHVYYDIHRRVYHYNHYDRGWLAVNRLPSYIILPRNNHHKLKYRHNRPWKEPHAKKRHHAHRYVTSHHNPRHDSIHHRDRHQPVGIKSKQERSRLHPGNMLPSQYRHARHKQSHQKPVLTQRQLKTLKQQKANHQGRSHKQQQANHQGRSHKQQHANHQGKTLKQQKANRQGRSLKQQQANRRGKTLKQQKANRQGRSLKQQQANRQGRSLKQQQANRQGKILKQQQANRQGKTLKQQKANHQGKTTKQQQANKHLLRHNNHLTKKERRKLHRVDRSNLLAKQGERSTVSSR